MNLRAHFQIALEMIFSGLTPSLYGVCLTEHLTAVQAHLQLP